MKITHDFHIHTSRSLCANESATVEHYVENAAVLGLKKLGFADHFWDENVPNTGKFYKIEHYDHVATIKDELEKFKGQGVELYFGCECEYDYNSRGIAVTEEVAEKFDFIIVPNSHTHMTMPKEFYHPYEKHIEFMINAYTDILSSPLAKYVTAIAHPFNAVCCPYGADVLRDMISDDTYKRLFTMAAEKGVAIEANLYDLIEDEAHDIEKWNPLRLMKIAKECGCKFTFGSDSHNSSFHLGFAAADKVADAIGLTEDDLIDLVK